MITMMSGRHDTGGEFSFFSFFPFSGHIHTGAFLLHYYKEVSTKSLTQQGVHGKRGGGLSRATDGSRGERKMCCGFSLHRELLFLERQTPGVRSKNFLRNINGSVLVIRNGTVLGGLVGSRSVFGHHGKGTTSSSLH